MSDKILIVDDDIDSLKLIGLMLQRQGYEVIAANAGNQAIAKATGEIPDLIILDVMMPDMNGYEVCRRLRGNPSTAEIPIIMFTAKTLIDDKVAGFEAGADDYLTKPTHPAELASRVKAILQRNAAEHGKSDDMGVVLGVIGAKGGVGTTTVAINIAAALKVLGEDPVIVDFRPGNGSLSLYLGMSRDTSLADVLKYPTSEIDEHLRDHLVAHETGLKALLSSVFPKESLSPLPADSASAILSGLRGITHQTIVDLGSGYSPLVDKLIDSIDHFIVVIDPMDVTLTMTRALLQELYKKGKERVHVVVVNRNKINLQPPWQKVEKTLDHEIRAILSPAPELAFQAAEAGKPIVTYQPNSIVSSQLTKLAEDINKILRKNGR